MSAREPGRDDELVVFPHLHVERDGASCVVENLVFGTRLRASSDLLVVLEAFAQPRTPSAFCAEYELPVDSLDRLLASFLLVPAAEVGFLAGGLVSAPRDVPALGRATTWWELAERARPGGWVVFGAPYDAAATHAGARYGPRAVREHAPRVFASGTRAIDDLEHRRTYELAELTVLDTGDVARSPGESLDVFGARIGKLVRRTLDLGMRPAMIGGDHSTTWFVLRELLDRHGALGVIHFDAHPDLYASVTEAVLTHANVFSFVLERPELEVLLQLGVRTLDPVEPFSRRVDEPRLQWRSARELRGLEPAEVFGALRRDLPYYLTFDIDCLDPAIAPETGAPVPGGLDYYQGLALLEHAARELDLVGVDLVEVTDGPSRVNQAAAIAGRYLCQLLLGRAGSTALASPRHRHHRSSPP